MKRSLLVTRDYPPVRGGTSNALWQFSTQFPSDNFFVLTEPSKIFINSDFKIIRKKFHSNSRYVWPRWLPLYSHIMKIIKEEGVKVIQVGQILPIGTVALLIKKLHKIPYVVYVYGQDLVIMRRSRRKSLLIKRILKNADGIVACSNYTKRLAISLGADPEKSLVAYPCPRLHSNIEVSQLEIDGFIQNNGLTDKKILLSVGNLVRRKGHDMVIKSLSQVVKSIPNLIYFIVGNGPEKKRLVWLIKSLNLEKFVKVEDSVPNNRLPLYYACANLFIMPSRELKNEYNETIDVEGFGLVFIEANMFGIPVIGGRSGGVPEAIADGISGLLVNPTDEYEIAGAVKKLLSSEKYSRQLGEGGKTRAIRDFKIFDESKKIINLLK